MVTHPTSVEARSKAHGNVAIHRTVRARAGHPLVPVGRRCYGATVCEIAATRPSRAVIGTLLLACVAWLAVLAAGMPWFVTIVPPVLVTLAAVAIGRTVVTGALAQRDGRLREQAEALDRLASAVELARVGMWQWDLRRGRVDYDRMCAKMLGYGESEIDSTLSSWGKLVHPDDLAGARRAIDELVDGKSARYEARVRLRAADGSWRMIIDRGTVTARDDNGRPSRAVGVHIEATTIPAAAPLAPTTRGRWVIIDDDESVRVVIETAARRLGLDTVSFGDPQRAWEAIAAGTPLGIITDFEMPGMNGVQLAERVRAAGMGCPLLLVSGASSPLLRECRAIDGLLSKPFTIASLESWLDRHAARPARQ